MDREALLAEARDFRGRAPDAGGIHLVGAHGELRHAVHLRGLERRDFDIQFERRQELLQTGRRARRARPFRPLRVHLAAAAIFLGDARPVEGPHVGQEAGDFLGAGGQQQREHLRSAGLHLPHLLGIVVHQDQGVEAQFQFLGERRQVAGLGIPIDALRHEIARRQRHFRMRAESSHHVLRIILAAQGKQHTGAAALRHQFLQCAARRVEHDALGTVLAADARPQGVVAIERDCLERGRGDGVDLPRQRRGQGHEIERRIRHASQFVGVWVVHLRHRVEGGDFGGGEQVDRGQSGDAAAHLLVQLDGAWTQHDDQRDTHASGRGAHGIHESGGLSGGPVVETDQHHIDAAGIAAEQSRGVEQFLKDLMVGGEAQVGGQSQFAHPEGQAGLDGVGGKSSADRDEQIPLY